MQALLRYILKPVNRRRHRRGFGIHSPFAFRFVTEVLCQPLPYYGYADIGRDSRLRLLLRLTASFRPATVLLLSSQPDRLAATVRRASPSAKTVKKADGVRPDFVVADDLDARPADYLPLVEDGAHLLLLNAAKESIREIRAELSRGMLFDNNRGTVVVAAYAHLPRQNFDVKF